MFKEKFESKLEKVKDLKDYEEKNRINIYNLNSINPQTPNYLEAQVPEKFYSDLNPNSMNLLLTTSDFEMKTGVTNVYEFKAESEEDKENNIIVSFLILRLNSLLMNQTLLLLIKKILLTSIYLFLENITQYK